MDQASARPSQLPEAAGGRMAQPGAGRFMYLCSTRTVNRQAGNTA